MTSLPVLLIILGMIIALFYILMQYETIQIMGVLNTRKNKKYNYQPRYYKGDGSPFELKHKFDDFRVM